MASRYVARHRHKAPGRVTVAVAAVPVIMMAGAWTAAVAQSSSSPQAAGADRAASGVPQLPDTAEAPDAAPQVRQVRATTPRGPAAVTSARGVSDQDVPVHSLGAYRRAATVLATSQAACRLPWNLVAAIGKVESNHGRFGGNAVGPDGVSRPGIRGIALDGTNNTARIMDTDAGALDGDRTYDRAVGPMQFIPSSWNAVAVDGDGDGIKNPQDIDDAAMSAGVYLCAGGADLSTPGGARSAVLRYNQSGSYADLVLSIAARYAAGDYSEAPDNVVVPQAPGAPTEINTPGKGQNPTKADRDRGATLTPAPVKPAKPGKGVKPMKPAPTKPTPTKPTPTKPAPPKTALVDKNDKVVGAEAEEYVGKRLPICSATVVGTAAKPCVVKVKGDGEPEPEPPPTAVVDGNDTVTGADADAYRDKRLPICSPTVPGTADEPCVTKVDGDGEPEPETPPTEEPPPARETAVVDGNDTVTGADADAMRGEELPLCTEAQPGSADDPCVTKVEGDGDEQQDEGDQQDGEESTEPDQG